MVFTDAWEQMKESGGPAWSVARMMRQMAYCRIIKRRMPAEAFDAFQQAGIDPMTIALPRPPAGE